MASYAPEIRVENGRGEEMMSGSDEIRSFYTDLFNNSPELHCEVMNRTAVGDWVIDEEKIQGLNAEGFSRGGACCGSVYREQRANHVRADVLLR